MLSCKKPILDAYSLEYLPNWNYVRSIKLLIAVLPHRHYSQEKGFKINIFYVEINHTPSLYKSIFLSNEKSFHQ